LHWIASPLALLAMTGLLATIGAARGITTMAKTSPPMHPGEVLREEFLVPMNLSPYALAKICDVPRTRIERIAREEISITADTALRLSKALGTMAGFWLNLQTQFDIATAEKAIGKALAKIVPVSRDAA
jgi:addiction module HigA family antidote